MHIFIPITGNIKLNTQLFDPPFCAIATCSGVQNIEFQFLKSIFQVPYPIKFTTKIRQLIMYCIHVKPLIIYEKNIKFYKKDNSC